MKRIEKYFDEFCGGLMCEPYEREKNIELECEHKSCSECPHKKIIIDWLLEEYKEPIQLTQIEYDTLEIIYNLDEYKMGETIKDWSILRYLKQKGHFNNVDKNMKINDILNNCEVINNE